MLLGFGIKPVMVFDGRHLPAKALTEAKRREYVIRMVGNKNKFLIITNISLELVKMPKQERLN